MNATQIETTISQLVADGMPTHLATKGWTVPEGMDCPWDNLAELLSGLSLDEAEWAGGSLGLLATHFFVEGAGEPQYPITESFVPIATS